MPRPHSKDKRTRYNDPTISRQGSFGGVAHTGVSSLVCFLESEKKRFALKVLLFLTDGNGESRFLKEWESVGVKVPHVLEDGQNARSHAYPYRRRIMEGKPEYETFEGWLLGPGIQKRVNAMRELGPLGDEHGRIDKVFGALLAHAKVQPSSALCHFDFTPNNILATEPLTVFDPSPILNHGIIDIG